jgi:hypothetical protein
MDKNYLKCYVDSDIDIELIGNARAEGSSIFIDKKETEQEKIYKEYRAWWDSGFKNHILTDLSFVEEKGFGTIPSRPFPSSPFLFDRCKIKPIKEKPKTFNGTLTFEILNNSLPNMKDTYERLCKAFISEEDQYKGCVPFIAEALKKGEHIKARCYDECESDYEDLFVIGYVKESKEPYVVKYKDGEVTEYENVKAIPKTEKRVIGKKAMVNALLDNDFFPNDDGEWVNCDGTQVFKAWHKCGKPVDCCRWLYWMIEEVEI